MRLFPLNSLSCSPDPKDRQANQQEGCFLFYSQDEEKQSSLSVIQSRWTRKQNYTLFAVPIFESDSLAKSYYLERYFNIGKHKMVVHMCVNTYMNLSTHQLIPQHYFPPKVHMDVPRQHYEAAQQGFLVYGALSIYLCCCQPPPLNICHFLPLTALSGKQGWPAPGGLDWTGSSARYVCIYMRLPFHTNTNNPGKSGHSP